MSKNQKKSEIGVQRKSPRLNEVDGIIVAPVLKLNSKLKNLKQNSTKQKKNDILIEDLYEKVQNAKEMIRRNTGLVYDRRMANHECLWDRAHQECPDRLIKTLDRCKEWGLVDRCQPIKGRQATIDELLSVHSQAHIDVLRNTDGCTDVDHLEQVASHYSAVYIHPETYQLALLSAGCTVELVSAVCSGAVQNGMAIVRPPGHHAMESDYCGYCFFNNVAVAAHHILNNTDISRILILDWDAHHGQATQQMFYSDPRVVYFSIHRYEHGEFWPNLRESDYDYVGEGQGVGYNFNVPLNKTDMSDADYLAIFHQVLLPMASEFQPELIIVSAGFDAAVGCPEGGMAVTPACYAHLVSSLMGLASGKVAVILEGGYCVRSLAESAAHTLRALLHEPCPNLPALSAPSQSIQESILNCIYSHRPFWKCFQWQGSYPVSDRDPENVAQHWPEVHYNYDGPTTMTSYPTRNTCPVQTEATKAEVNKKLDTLIDETKLLKTKHDVALVYDPLMMEHKNLKDPGHPENPYRIQRIYERLLDYSLLDRLFVLQSRYASREELLLVHEEAYLNEMEQLCASTEHMTDDAKYKHAVLEKKNSVYIHPQSYKNASLAAGSLLQVVDSVMQGESKAGVAVIRPPGHHAESYQACGFCFFNNVSIAAKYALKKYGLKRIMILDWDVHHGNGTQRIFLSDPQVLYISIHRYDNGSFFPASKEAAATIVGSGPGVGFNVNIPWNQKGMGNAEYLAAFQQVVLPVAYQFSPELVLVSAGFDAAVGDPLGGCKVSPETYGLLTSWLIPLAMGRVILCLEGGYNLTSISYAMTMCTKTLLGDPVPPVDLDLPLKPSAIKDLKSVLNIQMKHWSALIFNKDFPNEDVLNIASAKQNDLVKDIDYSFNKVSLLDNISDSETDNRNIVENLNEKFDSQMYISKNSPLLIESPAPNLFEWNGLLTQVPDNERGEASSSGLGDGISKPGPSQGTAGSDKVMELQSIEIDSILKEMDLEGGFAVYPNHDCPHLDAVTAVPTSGIDITSSCLECESDSSATLENWACLTCYSVHCGRVVNEHMMFHSTELSHPIVLGFQDLSVWCYLCDSYIESPVLYDAKNAAYINKFGEVMPNIYGQ